MKNNRALIINHEIDPKFLENEYEISLDSRRISSKLLYIGKKSVERYEQFCRDTRTLYYHREVDLLEKSMNPIVQHLYKEQGQRYNILCLGVGLGEKSKIITQSLIENQKPFSFFPVDVSEEMIRKGVENLPESINDVEAYVGDFLESNTYFSDLSERIRKENHAHHLITLLGNTLGNNIRQGEILSTIRRGMEKNDFFLLGVKLKKQGNIKKIMTSIHKTIELHGSPVFREFVFTPLENVGFTWADGYIEVEYTPNRFFPEISTINIFFSFRRDRTIQYNGYDIHFHKGERILLYMSHRYPENTAESLLTVHGFQVVEKYISSHKTGAMYLCKPV